MSPSDFLAHAHHALLFPTHEALDRNILLRLTGLPVFPIGLVDEPTQAHSVMVNPNTFAEHDLFHADFSLRARKNLDLNNAESLARDLKNTGKLDELLRAASSTAPRRLREAIGYVLFYFLHEIPRTLDVFFKDAKLPYFWDEGRFVRTPRGVFGVKELYDVPLNAGRADDAALEAEMVDAAKWLQQYFAQTPQRD